MAVKKSRKPVAKKAAPKKKAVVKAAAPAKKMTAIKDPMTKTQILTNISEATELSKKQVASVFDELSILIERSIKPRGAGSFTIPGLCKVLSVRKPAKKAKKGINPFTGEETTFKAKPAHNVVKIRALKKLKDMAS